VKCCSSHSYLKSSEGQTCNVTSTFIYGRLQSRRQKAEIGGKVEGIWGQKSPRRKSPIGV